MLDHDKYLKTQPVFNNDATSEPIDPALLFKVPEALVGQKPKSLLTPFDTAGLITSVAYAGCLPDLYNNAKLVLTSSSDKSLRVFDVNTQKLQHVFHAVHGSSAAIRSITYIGKGIVVTGGMDGRFVATDLISKQEVGAERAHGRFINGVAFNSAHSVLASAGFDGFLKLYKIDVVESEPRKVTFTLLGSHKFLQIPTAVALVELAECPGLTLLACTQDSTFMHFLQVPSTPTDEPVDILQEIRKINLLDAEYSSLVTFTPLDISIAPDGSNRYAVATSHAPHMRIILGNLNETEIEKNLLAYAPQDKFSNPRIKWSTDGKGIWATGDDGIVRGIEVVTGKVVAELKNGHDNKVSAYQCKKFY